MPSTPELWKDLGLIETVNPNNTLQSAPQVYHLTNCNILVASSQQQILTRGHRAYPTSSIEFLPRLATLNGTHLARAIARPTARAILTSRPRRATASVSAA
jgi:hypothetical protein